MREREFWELLEEVFGRTYGRSLSRDQRMPKLANMTVVEALDAGANDYVTKPFSMPILLEKILSLIHI